MTKYFLLAAGNMAFNFPYLTVEQIVDAAGELCPELELLEPHFKKPSVSMQTII